MNIIHAVSHMVNTPFWSNHSIFRNWTGYYLPIDTHCGSLCISLFTILPEIPSYLFSKLIVDHFNFLPTCICRNSQILLVLACRLSTSSALVFQSGCLPEGRCSLWKIFKLTNLFMMWSQVQFPFEQNRFHHPPISVSFDLSLRKQGDKALMIEWSR